MQLNLFMEHTEKLNKNILSKVIAVFSTFFNVNTFCGINGKLHDLKSRQCLYIFRNGIKLGLVELIDFKQ